MNIKNCKHENICNGPRLPMRYGTSPSDICVDCGAYRYTLHHPGKWKYQAIQIEFIEYYNDED